MGNYFSNLNRIPTVKDYLFIFNKKFIPLFLYNYIDLPIIQRLGDIDYFRGQTHREKQSIKYSRLDHSIQVAITTWNFTHDKTQTLAALFHDVSSPIFHHVIEYKNGDKLTQSSNRDKRVEELISPDELLVLNSYLKRDGVSFDNVFNLKKDNLITNTTPKFCIDRLDFVFAANLFWTRVDNFNLDEVKYLYDNLFVGINKEGQSELVTKDVDVARRIVELSVLCGIETNSNFDNITMHLLADLVDSAIKNKLIVSGEILTEERLYIITESKFISAVKNNKIEELLVLWNTFLEMESFEERYTEFKKDDEYYYQSLEEVNGVFPVRRRYIDVLVEKRNKLRRVSEIDKDAARNIQQYMEFYPESYARVKKIKN